MFKDERSQKHEELKNMFEMGMLTAENFLTLITGVYDICEDEAIALYVDWTLSKDKKYQRLEAQLESAVRRYNTALTETNLYSTASLPDQVTFVDAAAAGNFEGLADFTADVKAIRRMRKRVAGLKAKVFVAAEAMDDYEEEMYSRARRDLLSE